MKLWSKEAMHFESPFGSFHKSQDYLEWLMEFYEMTQKMGGTRHFIMNPVVTLKGDVAEFKGYLYIMNKRDGSFMGTSVMYDKLKQMDGQWKFMYRSVMPDQDMSKLGGQLSKESY